MNCLSPVRLSDLKIKLTYVVQFESMFVLLFPHGTIFELVGKHRAWKCRLFLLLFFQNAIKFVFVVFTVHQNVGCGNTKK